MTLDTNVTVVWNASQSVNDNFPLQAELRRVLDKEIELVDNRALAGLYNSSTA